MTLGTIAGSPITIEIQRIGEETAGQIPIVATLFGRLEWGALATANGRTVIAVLSDQLTLRAIHTLDDRCGSGLAPFALLSLEPGAAMVGGATECVPGLSPSEQIPSGGGFFVSRYQLSSMQFARALGANPPRSPLSGVTASAVESGSNVVVVYGNAAAPLQFADWRIQANSGPAFFRMEVRP